jgi:hypothetical protein
MYMTYGKTGANLREFNEMLGNKGLSPMRKGYSNLSFGYLTGSMILLSVWNCFTTAVPNLISGTLKLIINPLGFMLM